MSEKLYMINILETGNKNNYTGKMKDKSVVIMLYPRTVSDMLNRLTKIEKNLNLKAAVIKRKN